MKKELKKINRYIKDLENSSEALETKCMALFNEKQALITENLELKNQVEKEVESYKFSVTSYKKDLQRSERSKELVEKLGQTLDSTGFSHFVIDVTFQGDEPKSNKYRIIRTESSELNGQEFLQYLLNAINPMAPKKKALFECKILLQRFFP